MATNYLQEGKTIEFTAAADVASGSAVVVGTVVVVAISTVLSGELAVGMTDGVFDLPKGTGAITQGAKVYLKSDGTITATASGNTAAGTCWSAAADSDTSIAVKLNR
ncbi:DUF2190 family protein [Endozoicomonas sp. SCSIO W0465]|uniref:DUF2190 family protein n=1 Tax=Endozoicomonas sp. SCSIO W0465 TaxID=2918516 RepID=UPI002075914D|nr:capsid cement protein [Endozoicomonas sp. SCSIO W0465]USE38935.1 DUF2190 family protein [Endozoicomonas sp. SCSIO W0465]